MFNRITVLGVGLIGASFARAMKKNGLAAHITGYGRKKENLEEAKKRGFIDSFELNPAAACSGSDLVMLSAPVGSFTDLAKKIIPTLRRGAIVTDAGSVKGSLVHEIEKLMSDGVSYIGAHPIAGSDRSGIDASSAELFCNAKCIVTPTELSDPDALGKVLNLWKALGSDVMTMTPEEHDRVYAAVSHLPHVVAYALVNTVAGTNSSYLNFCGRGFTDMTRIASSSPELWTDICLFNRENLAEVISAFQRNLDSLSQYLRAADAASLKREFEKARKLREAIGQD